MSIVVLTLLFTLTDTISLNLLGYQYMGLLMVTQEMCCTQITIQRLLQDITLNTVKQ
jgi:hypothetical protein